MKAHERWYSARVEQDVTLLRWGHYGQPLLLFPTAGGDAEECERCGLIGALWPLIEAGTIKVYSVDSIAGRTWLSDAHPRHRAWVQKQYGEMIYREVVPAIRGDCMNGDIEIVAAGASIGAFNAVAVLCRYPDVFARAIGMSGTYDLEPWMHGDFCDDFYFSSPLCFLPNLQHDRLAQLQRRFVLLASGTGRYEDPEQSWRMAAALGHKGIANRVDIWDGHWDHDWPTWQHMLPHYLGQ